MNDETVSSGVGAAAQDGRASTLFQARLVRYGLPCANCRAYYSSGLTVCPVCQCSERVSPVAALVRSVAAL